MLRLAATVLIALLLAPASAGAHPADDQTDRTGRPRVYVLHDSVMLSARDDVRGALPDHEVNYDGFGGFLVAAAPELILRQRHLIDDIVVIELGTNYLGNPDFFRASVRRTLDLLRDVERVIWVTPKRYRSGMDTVNAILDEEAWTRPNVELADWTSIATDPTMTWFPGDVHLSWAGQRRMADLVARHVRGRGEYDDAPIGAVAARAQRRGLEVRGWAADPDAAGAVDVRIWIDARPVITRRAGIERPDIAHLGHGTRHGFRHVAAVVDGPHTVCVEAVNHQSARRRWLGCTIVVTDNEPTGSVGAAAVEADVVEVRGWTMDPDGRRPIGAHLFVDGVFARARPADGLRRDVEARYGNGARHGFRFVVDVGPGRHEVCVRGINIRAGLRNPTVGCRTLEVR